MKTTMKKIVIMIGLLFVGLLVNSNINTDRELVSPSVIIDSEILIEDDIQLEDWMTLPFVKIANVTIHKTNYIFYEEKLVVEDWMTKPFGGTIEEVMVLEPWMLVPFYV